MTPLDTKSEHLQRLRIDRNDRGSSEPAPWAKRYIVIGIVIVAVLSISALAYRLLSPTVPEVDVARATVESAAEPGNVLTASGYIVAHHKISVNSKVTGRVAWIGVEKGDKVKQGQVLVRLEDQEFRAQVEQARGATESAKAYLRELQTGSRPQEIQQSQHNLDEARATLVNDKINLERMQNLFQGGVASKQQLDDALAKYKSSQEHVDSLQQAYQLMHIGPRQEEIDRAQGNLTQAQGQLAYAQAQLDATLIRAPVTGTILERTAEKGELVTAQFASGAEGGPRGSVVALADLNDLQVELDIAQDDFARLGPKQKAVVTTDAYPDRKYNGTIAEISPEANRQKATVQVKVQIVNPDEYLRPEMNATVKFLSEAPTTMSKTPQGAVVPTAAVKDRDGKKVVFLAYKGRALLREVQVLATRSNGYLVKGLNGGEDVIITAPADLKNGDKIKIKGES